MRRTPAAPALLCLALLAAAAGCGGDSTSDAGASGSPSASSSPSESPSVSESSSPTSSPSASGSASSSPTSSSTADPVPFPGDLRADDGGLGVGNGLGVTGVRVGRQQGFDRVVFDLSGTGTPGWRVSYVDRPVQDGSGDPVKIAGSAYLQVDLRGLGMPSDTGVPQFGDSTTRVRGIGGVAEVAPGAVFEGQQQAFIGLTGSRRPFRVFALTGPTRVVVDVRRD